MTVRVATLAPATDPADPTIGPPKTTVSHPVHPAWVVHHIQSPLPFANLPTNRRQLWPRT